MRLQRRFALKGLIDIRVITPADGELLGYIADISVGGFRVTSEEAVAPQSAFSVDLLIPVRAEHHRTLSLPVICKWSRYDARLKRFNIGIQLQEPSEPFLELLSELRGMLKLSRRQPV